MFKLKTMIAVAVMAAIAVTGGCGSDDDAEEPEEPGKMIWVAGHKEECTGVGPQECYLVKETPDGDWTLLYDEIEGFDYEEGYEYEIVVAETVVDNPPADASSKRWTFVRLMRRTDASLLVPGGALAGHDWSLRAFDVAGAEQPLVAGTEITLTLDAEGKIAGTGGCNRYFGSYETGGDGAISFGTVGATRMACPTEIMDQEQRFFTALEAATVYVVDAGGLALSGNEEAALLFTRSEQPRE